MNVLLFPFWLIFSIITPAYAECTCTCVSGVNQAICDNDSELPPMCAKELCPTVNFEMAPAQPDEIEPMGTELCTMRQVLEDGQYVWRSLCE